MARFIHTPFKNPKNLQRISLSGKRYYSCNGSTYPSVTTVLSSVINPGIESWRKRVGNKEAEKISREAANRGGTLHTLIEKYLKNERDFSNILSATPSKPKILFNNLRLYLNKITNIKCLETFLYSDKYKVAGTVDIISDFNYGLQGKNGNLTVGDFKSSTKRKREEWIEDYFMQVFMYSWMFEEISGEIVDKIAIFIASEDGSVQIFQKLIEERPYYIEKFTSILDKFFIDNPS